ncbi:MAG: hypothetical protein ABH890_03710 [Bacillota bacterium]
MKGHVDYTKDELFMALFNQVGNFVDHFDPKNKDIYYTIHQFRYIVHINGSLIERRLELLHSKLSDTVTEVSFNFPPDYKMITDKADVYISQLSLRFS